MIKVALDDKAVKTVQKIIGGGSGENPQLLEALKNFKYALTKNPSRASTITEVVREFCSDIVGDEVEGDNLTEIINNATAKLPEPLPMIEGVRDYIDSLSVPTFYPQLFRDFLNSKGITNDITIDLTNSSGSAVTVLDNRFLEIIGYSPVPNSYKGKIVILNSDANTKEVDFLSSEFSLFDFLGMIPNIQISLKNIQWFEEPLTAGIWFFAEEEQPISITLDELKTFIK